MEIKSEAVKNKIAWKALILSEDLGLSPSATTVKWPSKLGQGVEPLEYSFLPYLRLIIALISQGSLRIN